MLFGSIEFLFFFLPIVLLLTRLLSVPMQNLALVLLSLLFVFLSDAAHFPVFLFVLSFSYLSALLIARKKGQAAFVLSVGILVLLLVFFKYVSPRLSGTPLSFLYTTLPVGISFYTFQAISYLADVRNGTVLPEKSPIRFSAYLALFPQLIAGPIVRYEDVADDLLKRKAQGGDGLCRFLLGLGKKLLIADAMGEYFALAKASPSSALIAFFGLIAASFQIYFDFSGYSDMAIGLGKMLGFRFPENFRYPYIAENARDFWRRWHITLSDFFKNYVYIPLGGNRRGRLRTFFNLLTVWVLTGLWHGGTLNFLLWGLYWFFFLSLERFTPFGRLLERSPRLLRHFYTLTVILFGWLIFSFTDIPSLVSYTSALFSAPLVTPLALYDIIRTLPVFILAALLSTPIPYRIFREISLRRPFFSTALPLLVFALSVSFLLYRDYSPFLYFRF